MEYDNVHITTLYTVQTFVDISHWSKLENCDLPTRNYCKKFICSSLLCKLGQLIYESKGDPSVIGLLLSRLSNS